MEYINTIPICKKMGKEFVIENIGKLGHLSHFQNFVKKYLLWGKKIDFSFTL